MNESYDEFPGGVKVYKQMNRKITTTTPKEAELSHYITMMVKYFGKRHRKINVSISSLAVSHCYPAKFTDNGNVLESPSIPRLVVLLHRNIENYEIDKLLKLMDNG